MSPSRSTFSEVQYIRLDTIRVAIFWTMFAGIVRPLEDQWIPALRVDGQPIDAGEAFA